MNAAQTYTAFDGFQRIARANLEKVLLAVKKRTKAQRDASVLIFSDSTGKQMDFDLSGSDADVIDRHKVFTTTVAPASPGVGRPKLGVVAREISLLPMHWEWLNTQTGGASLAIRQLVDEKMKLSVSDKQKAKNAKEVTYKFLTAIAGNLPNFEEAIRFLYRADRKKFLELVNEWPTDVVDHSLSLAEDAWEK